MAFHTLLFAVLATVLAAYAVVIDTEGLPDTGLDTSSWTAGQLPPLEDMWSLNDMQIAAKNVITPRFYGAEVQKTFVSICFNFVLQPLTALLLSMRLHIKII